MKHSERKGGFTLYLGELRQAIEAFRDKYREVHFVRPSLQDAVLLLIRTGLKRFTWNGEETL